MLAGISFLLNIGIYMKTGLLRDVQVYIPVYYIDISQNKQPYSVLFVYV